MDRHIKLNRTYNLNLCDNVSLTLGTINRIDPKVVYVNGRCWVSPLVEVDYKRVFNDIKHGMIGDIREVLIKEYGFESNFIFDFDVSICDMAPRCKKRLLTFEVFLKQDPSKQVDIVSLRDKMKCGIGELACNLSERLFNNGFKVSKTKRK